MPAPHPSYDRDSRTKSFSAALLAVFMSGLCVSATAAGPVDAETSRGAVQQLRTYLQSPRAERAELAAQPFVSVALSRADGQAARELLWEDVAEHLRAARASEMKDRKLVQETFTMPFYYRVTGDKPAKGRSLYISLHGGGGAPKPINDSQWENQKRLYSVPEGVYVAPRAPTDTWNLWHQAHIDPMFDRLIENMILFEDVDPNRVYVLGYSAGGDGVYRLAPRMADRWAAASMMAGHPGDVSPLNLRNTPFTLHVGANDTPYNRNKVAADWAARLNNLHEADPQGYIHWAKIYDGKGHWLDREDAAAIPWMAQHTRNPIPSKLVWRQDVHKRFYWLATPEINPGTVVRASYDDQTITIDPGASRQLTVRLTDQMLDLDRPITVTANEGIVFAGFVPRTIEVIAESLQERADPASIFFAQQTIKFARSDEDDE